MTFCLDIELAVEIHQTFADGGSLLRSGSLESALARPMQEPFGLTPYPTVTEKAAVLLHGVATSHAFYNANKRTAWTCCTTFLELHGISLAPIPDDEVADFVVYVVEGKVRHEGIVEWLLDRQL